MPQSFPIAPPGTPFVTAEQMREIDRAMVDDFGVTLLQMMENAGRNLATVIVHASSVGEQKSGRVVVLAGPGGNGGGGLVAARHLHNRGIDVSVILAAREDGVTDAVRHQLRILRKSGVSIESAETGDWIKLIDGAGVLVDALFGYSLDGPPREPAASFIRAMNEVGTPVVSNDIPTGIDATSGVIHEPAVRATATVTIALPKTGLLSPAAGPLVGDLYLGDIAVPPRLYKQVLGVSFAPIFTEGQVVKMPVAN